MKNILRHTIFILANLAIVPLVFGVVYAGSLKFDKATISANPAETIQIGIIVDAGSDQVTSTDAYVTYDPTLLETQSVSAGTFFPTVTNNITSGKVYVAGLVDDPAVFKTASGPLATITFKALKGGSGALAFDCQSAASSSKIIKNDTNATNVIQCTQNGSASVAVGGGGNPSGAGSSGSTSTNPAPSVLPKTGILENITKFAVPGAVLLLIGGVLRLVL